MIYSHLPELLTYSDVESVCRNVAFIAYTYDILIYTQLSRFWQIPLYAVAYLIHVRYRRWRPRVLPRLTNLTLPEIYGSLALGHAVDIEANRIQDKTFYSREGDPGRHLWYIVRASLVLRDAFREKVGPATDKEKGSERIWTDITYRTSERRPVFLEPRSASPASPLTVHADD